MNVIPKSPYSGEKRPRTPSVGEESPSAKRSAVAATRVLGTEYTHSPRSGSKRPRSLITEDVAPLAMRCAEVAAPVLVKILPSSPKVVAARPFLHLLVYYDTDFHGGLLAHDLDMRDLLMQVEKTIEKAPFAQKMAIRKWVRTLLDGPKETLFAEVGMFFYSVKTGEALLPPSDGFRPQLDNMIKQRRAEGDVRSFLRLFIDIMFLEKRTLNIGGVYAVYHVLSNAQGTYFEEEHRLQMLTLLSAMIHSSTFRSEIESRDLGEEINGMMAVLICQELGLPEEEEFSRAEAVYGILHCLLSPIRQEHGEGNCYVVGALQALLYQAPEKMFSLLFSFCKKCVIRGQEEEEISFAFLRSVHDAFSPDIPFTLQRLLIGIAEFYSLNLEANRRDIFHSWIESLLATSPADHPHYQEFIKELMDDFMRNFYFVDASRQGKFAVLCPSRTPGNADTLDMIGSVGELREHFLLACLFAAEENDGMEALSHAITAFLDSEEGNDWLQKVFHQERIDWQGDFPDVYAMLGMRLVAERQTVTSPEQLLQLLCNRSFVRPYLVGISEHGFIHSPSHVERYRDDPSAEFHTRVIARGKALMQKPFHRASREMIGKILGVDVHEPEEETLEAFCTRMHVLIPEEKSIKFSHLVNEFALFVTYNTLVDHILPQIVPAFMRGDALKKYLERQTLLTTTPHRYAQVLRKLYGWDAPFIESEICRLSGLPETVVLGDLFWMPERKEKPDAIHLAATFDVVRGEARLYQRSHNTHCFESWDFVGNEITLFLPA